jgi:hypothetical protein
MSEQTKPCPVCGKKMIRKYRHYIMATYPASHPWDWWCGCGHKEEGGIERGITPDEALRIQWEEANK